MTVNQSNPTAQANAVYAVDGLFNTCVEFSQVKPTTQLA